MSVEALREPVQANEQEEANLPALQEGQKCAELFGPREETASSESELLAPKRAVDLQQS